MAEAISSQSYSTLDDSSTWFDEYLERLHRVTERFEDSTGACTSHRKSIFEDVCLGPPEVVALPVVAGWLREAQRVVVLTGEGLAQESGVPTPGFRPTSERPGTGEGPRLARSLSTCSTGTDPAMPTLIPVEPLDARPATWQEFTEDPAGVWRWHRSHQERCARARPSQAHRMLAELESSLRGGLTLVTTAIDGLHLRAGSSPRTLYEVNGSIHRMRCDERVPRACLRELDLDDEDCAPQTLAAVAAVQDSGAASRPVPCCPRCGVRRRPHVLWGGEPRHEAFYFGRSTQRAAERCDVLLVVGAGITHGLAARMANAVLGHEGSRVILMNASLVQAPTGVLQLPGALGETVPALVAAVRSSTGPSPETEQIIRAFRKFDINGDGFISRDELTSVLQRLERGDSGCAWADRILQAVDLDGDDRIDYVDFLTWVMEGATPSEKSRLFSGHLPELREPAPKLAARRVVPRPSVSSEATSRTSSRGTSQRNGSASSHHGRGRPSLTTPTSSRSPSQLSVLSRTPSPPRSGVGAGSRTPVLPQISATTRNRCASKGRRGLGG